MKAELGLVATELLSKAPQQEQQHYFPWASALPSPPLTERAQEGQRGREHPRAPCHSSSWEPTRSCTEKGSYTLSHYLKHTFKHTMLSLRETIPLLFSASVLSLIARRKFQSPLQFQHVRLSQGRSVLGHEILTTSANASPHARFFLSAMIS